MKSHTLSLAWVCATHCAVSVLVFHGLVHAQTIESPKIESQDTRTLQDSRAQDGRQRPAVIPPGETERLKKLTEKATLPEDGERSVPSDTPATSKPEFESPQSHAPATKRE
jgi:hypothetical protein